MRWRVVLYLGVPTLLSGCNIAYYAAHNIVNEPAQEINEFKVRQRMRAAAVKSWRDECGRHPRHTFSGAYADGYIDGYADHLDDGGTPGAPGVPPPRYRRHANDLTLEGQAVQRDYLEGFQRGSQAAAANGGRQGVIVQIPLREAPPEAPLNITCIPAAPAPVMPVPPPPAMTAPVPPFGLRIPAPLPAPRSIQVRPPAPADPSIGPRVRARLQTSLYLLTKAAAAPAVVDKGEWVSVVRRPEVMLEIDLPTVMTPPDP